MELSLYSQKRLYLFIILTILASSFVLASSSLITKKSSPIVEKAVSPTDVGYHVTVCGGPSQIVVGNEMYVTVCSWYGNDQTGTPTPDITIGLHIRHEWGGSIVYWSQDVISDWAGRARFTVRADWGPGGYGMYGHAFTPEGGLADYDPKWLWVIDRPVDVTDPNHCDITTQDGHKDPLCVPKVDEGNK